MRCGQCGEVFDASSRLLPDELDGSKFVAVAAAADSAESGHFGTENIKFVSFSTPKNICSDWRAYLVRAVWVFAALLGVMGLAGQIVFHERDRIAAIEPGLKPWLLTFCVPMACALSPLKRIESIVIDSSVFSKIQEDAYRINLILKNTGALELALPAIELTLTNSLDQPVIRRVLHPADFDAKRSTIAPSAELPALFTLSIKADDPVERITGYRLLAFYP